MMNKDDRDNARESASADRWVCGCGHTDSSHSVGSNQSRLRCENCGTRHHWTTNSKRRDFGNIEMLQALDALDEKDAKIDELLEEIDELKFKNRRLRFEMDAEMPQVFVEGLVNLHRIKGPGGEKISIGWCPVTEAFRVQGELVSSDSLCSGIVIIPNGFNSVMIKVK